jgi:hypothetical protein
MGPLAEPSKDSVMFRRAVIVETRPFSVKASFPLRYPTCFGGRRDGGLHQHAGHCE